MADECGAAHLGGCTGTASLRCELCNVVNYCSWSHKRRHRAEHAAACPRLRLQAQQAKLLDDFFFTFMGDAKQLGCCSFLAKYGLHGGGLWKGECKCAGEAAAWGTLKDEGRCTWDLPHAWSPCGAPRTPPSSCSLNDWSDYCKWRQLPAESPAPVLLHWPLTVYHAFRVSLGSSWSKQELRIHYLGPERELDQLPVFGELLALLPDVNIRIDMIGPRIPASRDGDMVELNTLLRCGSSECEQQLSSSQKEGSPSSVRVYLHRGLYQELHTQVPMPDLVVAPNAGIPAFVSWRAAIEVLLAYGVPTIFTDYCEEACLMSLDCISSVQRNRVVFPVRPNPFRQPLVPWNKALDVPMYSNCFTFGIR